MPRGGRYYGDEDDYYDRWAEDDEEDPIRSSPPKYSQENFDKLNNTFMDLRNQGYIAASDYLCCMSCALADFSNKIETCFEKPKGIVYYHQQDGDRLHETGKFDLRYSGCEDSDPVTTEVGKAALAALEKAGVRASWSGDPDVCIEVDLCPL